MKTYFCILALLSAFVFTGMSCNPGVKVPANEVHFRSAHGTLALKHPQDTQMENVQIEISTNGTARARIGKLTTKNSPDVIDKSAAGTVAILRQNGENMVKSFEAGGAAVGAASAQAAGKVCEQMETAEVKPWQLVGMAQVKNPALRVKWSGVQYVVRTNTLWRLTDVSRVGVSTNGPFWPFMASPGGAVHDCKQMQVMGRNGDRQGSNFLVVCTLSHHGLTKASRIARSEHVGTDSRKPNWGMIRPDPKYFQRADPFVGR